MPKKVKLQLVGLNGNAFSVMGAFKNAARKQGWSPEEVKEVLDKAMASDYDHLLATIMKRCEDPWSGPPDGELEPCRTCLYRTDCDYEKDCDGGPDYYKRDLDVKPFKVLER